MHQGIYAGSISICLAPLYLYARDEHALWPLGSKEHLHEHLLISRDAIEIAVGRLVHGREEGESALGGG